MAAFGKYVLLEDEKYFSFANGLWKGKKAPYKRVGVIRNTNFSSFGELDLSDIAFLDVETKQFPPRKLESNDIIIERSGGGPKQPVGRVVQFKLEDGDYSFSNFTSRIRVEDKSAFDPTFVLFYLMFFYQEGLTEPLQQRTTGIRNLDFNRYKREVGIPQIALNEQKIIVKALSSIKESIRLAEKEIMITATLKKSLMHTLFTKGLLSEKQKQTEVGLIPQSWNVVPLQQTGEVVYGIQAAVANNTKPIGTKILTNVNITFEGRIDLKKLRYFKLTKPKHMATILKKGDILFNWRSGSKAHVGKTAFFDLEGEYTHSSFILRIRTKKEVSNKYLFYYLTYLRASGYFLRLQNYSVNAKFNASAVNALPTALPTHDEQAKIADCLTTVDLKLDAQIKKLSVLQALFRTMLFQLMKGQARVTGLGLNSEKVLAAT